jgi:ABC-type glutathione transport system ATPase component
MNQWMDVGLVEIKGPYPGLRPFHSEESMIFFGRDQQVNDLMERLDRARFTAVIGASGSGKSSLVRAGLIPALESGVMVAAGARWRFAAMRPEGKPLYYLAQALIEGIGPTPVEDPIDEVGSVTSTPLNLRRYLS